MTNKTTTDIHTTVSTGTTLGERAKIYALQLFNERGDARLTYHNFRQAAEVNILIREIADAENIIETAREAAEIASWFYLTGFLSDPKNTSVFARKNANEFLSVQQIPASSTEQVIACLQSIESGNVPRNDAARIFSDARNAWLFATDFFEKSAFLRFELELLLHEQYSKADWTQFRLQQIIGAKFYTAYAKEKYEIDTGRNLMSQKSLVEKSRNNTTMRDDEVVLRTFEGIEKRMPERAIQTFFRANYRNHINLSQIADNKANIMISVNAILISVVLSIASYQNISERNPAILAPVIVFVIAGLASLIFAVLSARPKVTSLNNGKKTMEEVKQNVAFFGNFVGLTVEQFEEAMDAVMRDGELMYGNMTRDLYYLGKVLDKKYRLLTMSYNIFMVGFATTVVFFLIALFL
ncbi:MAG: hypothetical protein ACI85O_001686 [Saprospiraceae bacterium]|jgi:hypothetical protein